MIASAHIAPFISTGLEADQAESSAKASGVSPCPVNADVSELSPLYSQTSTTEDEMNVIRQVVEHLSLGLEEISADISEQLASARLAALARRRS